MEQLTSFLREAKESGVLGMYYIELATGLRRGELLELKWEVLDLQQGNLRAMSCSLKSSLDVSSTFKVSCSQN